MEIELYTVEAGWNIPPAAACVICYLKSDGKGGGYFRLADGTATWEFEQNRIRITLVPEVLDVPGLTQVTVMLLQGEKQLSVFGFDIHVMHEAAMGISESADFFTLGSMTEINTAFAGLFAWTQTDSTLLLEQRPADAAATGAALAGKAPEGFGLGGGAKNITGQNLDEITRNGWYSYSNAVQAPDVYASLLFVHGVGDGSNVLQLVLLSNNCGTMICRRRYQSVWQP